MPNSYKSYQKLSKIVDVVLSTTSEDARVLRKECQKKKLIPSRARHLEWYKYFVNSCRRGVRGPTELSHLIVEAAELLGCMPKNTYLPVVSWCRAWPRTVCSCRGERQGVDKVVQSLRNIRSMYGKKSQNFFVDADETV